MVEKPKAPLCFLLLGVNQNQFENGMFDPEELIKKAKVFELFDRRKINFKEIDKKEYDESVKFLQDSLVDGIRQELREANLLSSEALIYMTKA